MKGKRLILAATLVALSALCFARKKDKAAAPVASRPKWMDSASSVYPADRYLCHVGGGNSKEEAELAAVTGVAAVFSQDITSTAQTSKRMRQQTQRGGTPQSEVSASISLSVQSKVAADDLVGVEIGGFWQDAAARWWAVAALDKRRAASIYEAMIKKRVADARLLVDVSPEGADYYSLETCARFSRAEDLLESSENLLHRLQVLDFKAAASLSPLSPSAKSVHKEAAGIISMIPVYVEVEGDETGRIKRALERALVGFGLRTSDIDVERYALKVSAWCTPRYTDTSVQCYYSLEGGLADEYMWETLVPLSLSGRTAGNDFVSAQNRALREIEAEVAEVFGAALAVFLDTKAGQ